MVMVARASSQGAGLPRGKPQRCLLHAYIGGGVSRQPTEVTGLVVRTRHVGLTAAVITAAKLLNWCCLGQEHVDFYEDQVLF